LKHYYGGDPPPLEIPDVHTFPKETIFKDRVELTTRISPPVNEAFLCWNLCPVFKIFISFD
nr:hypothetical protein [Tanacetum cinerariifolium]